MEEIMDLLSAYYTALLEKCYINYNGVGLRSDIYNFYLADPEWNLPRDNELYRSDMSHLAKEGYHFWLLVSIEGDVWDWAMYKDSRWTTLTGIIPENKMSEIIYRSANKLGLELETEHTSEMSMAARLPDDEMQYEI